MNYKELHIFTIHGSTFSFINVTSFNANETLITFAFTAQSNGGSKQAKFYVKNVAGFTTAERVEVSEKA